MIATSSAVSRIGGREASIFDRFLFLILAIVRPSRPECVFLSTIARPIVGGKPDQGGSRACSTLDALPPRIRPKDLQPVAALLDLLDRSLDVLVVDVAFEVDEKEVGRVAVDGDFGRGE